VPQLTPVPDIAHLENPRFETIADGHFSVLRVDSVEPVPVGTHVVLVFRVAGYDRDCDGSLMARLERVDRQGETTGWAPARISLGPDSALVVQEPAHLWEGR
jgi:hypothetical protein